MLVGQDLPRRDLNLPKTAQQVPILPAKKSRVPLVVIEDDEEDEQYTEAKAALVEVSDDEFQDCKGGKVCIHRTLGFACNFTYTNLLVGQDLPRRDSNLPKTAQQVPNLPAKKSGVLVVIEDDEEDEQYTEAKAVAAIVEVSDDDLQEGGEVCLMN